SAPHTRVSYLFFLTDTATTQIYTLSLHDALPIFSLKEFILAENLVDASKIKVIEDGSSNGVSLEAFDRRQLKENHLVAAMMRVRSEEHTSELQSRENLVCRLLLEKKKETKRNVQI